MARPSQDKAHAVLADRSIGAYTGAAEAMQTQFAISVDQLKSLMEKRKLDAAEYLKDKIGGINELVVLLKSSADDGLSGAVYDIKRRQEVFGVNVIPPRHRKSFLRHVWEALQDASFIVVVVAIIVSLVASFLPASSKWGGLGILAVVIVLVFVTAFNDWRKEQQFACHESRIESKREVSVIRQGVAQQISVGDLVVGDICQIIHGDLVPADGILLQTNDLRVDESTMTGESTLVQKNIDTDPVLLSDTRIAEGWGKMIVTAVGVNAQVGVILALLDAIAKKTLSDSTNVAASGAESDINDAGVTEARSA